MPIRFQVDADFYDHPKTTGMSDAAFSLWVRAGSFSAAKLLDGFVSDDVLVHTLRSNVEVAEELVSRGLWRRRKGGFQFHQYAERNLTRGRVEADRTIDRERKRRKRSGEKPKRSSSDETVDNSEFEDRHEPESGELQADPPFVQTDTARTPDGLQSESDGNPDVSVSVSVSESFYGGPVSRGGYVSNARENDQRPPDRCPKHINNPTADPCRGCRDARQAAEAWDQATEARRDAVLKAIEAAMTDPRQRCEHGVDGGKFIHPDTGKSARCAHCRRPARAGP